jgi:DNA-binding transcriptional LysR family regulator
MRRLPPLNALRAFDATARQLSIFRAAQELHVTRSAVSHQIRQLEQWFGKALFVRHSSGVRLTVDGQSLAQTSNHIFALLETCCAQMAERAPATGIALEAPAHSRAENTSG